MRSWAEMVSEFNEANGYAPPKGGARHPSDANKLLRIRLMMEELGELSCAMHTNNMEEVADGVTDLLYVVVGTAVEYGFGPILDKLFREVQRSNMTKDFIDRGDGRKGGIKGPKFEKPRIGEILDDWNDACKNIWEPGLK